MNKLLVFAVCGVLALASCNRDKKSALNPSEIQSDSLRNIIDARDHEINDMMGTLNDIQQGFAAINEAENRVTIAKNGEAANKTEQMKENIQFIAQRMQENRELIKKLQQQLRETGFKGDAMKETLSRLTSQLSAKETELNPAEFGFTAPDEVIHDLIMNARDSEGYSDSKGIFSARKAIMQYHQHKP